MLALKRSSRGEANVMRPDRGRPGPVRRGSLQRRDKEASPTARRSVTSTRPDAARSPPPASPEAIDAVLVHSLQPDLLHPSNAPAVQQDGPLARRRHRRRQRVLVAARHAVAGALHDSASGSFRHVLCVASSAATRTRGRDAPGLPHLRGRRLPAFVAGPVPAGHGLLGQFLRTTSRFRDAIVHAVMVDGRAERAWYKHEGHVD